MCQPPPTTPPLVYMKACEADCVQVTYSVMKEDKSQQYIIDPSTDLCRRQCFQSHFQRLHSLSDKMNTICFHSAR